MRVFLNVVCPEQFDQCFPLFQTHHSDIFRSHNCSAIDGYYRVHAWKRVWVDFDDLHFYLVLAYGNCCLVEDFTVGVALPPYEYTPLLLDILHSFVLCLSTSSIESEMFFAGKSLCWALCKEVQRNKIIAPPAIPQAFFRWLVSVA